jgi:hypothetical protein
MWCNSLRGEPGERPSPGVGRDSSTGTINIALGLAHMERFGDIDGRDPMPIVFGRVLRRTYELRDGPLPTRLEELLQRLGTLTDDDLAARRVR